MIGRGNDGFRIADTFTDSLARLTGEEQKTVKTTAFDLQLNPANPGMSFHKLDKSKDKNFWSARVSGDIRGEGVGRLEPFPTLLSAAGGNFDFETQVLDHAPDFWGRLAWCREVAVLKNHGFFATTLPFSHT